MNNLNDKVETVPEAQRYELERMLSDARVEAHFCIRGTGAGPKSIRLGAYRKS